MRRFTRVSAGCLWVCARIFLLAGSQAGAQSSSETAGAQTGVGPAERNAMLISRISQRMMANLKRQPNYTCTETVERSHRASATHKFQLIDTIRLEVALVGGKEMYGWPGAKKFENTELSEIIGAGGAIANGDFALHARAIFGSGAAAFEYRAAGETATQPWVRFDYRVALARSGFSLRVGDREAIVAYHGSIEADPVSLDVERIDVIADQIPRDLGIHITTDHLEYARKRIGDSDFLLPSESELTMVDNDGGENRNHVRFASCRQFSGESVLTFDDPPVSTAEAPAHIEDIDLPPDLELTLVLADDIDLTKAAIGDPVHARLQNDLKVKGSVLLAKNAVATGRLTRLEHHDDHILLGLMFDELDLPAVRAHARLKMLGVFGADRITSRRNYALAPLKPGEGVIPIAGGVKRVTHGLTMLWSTEP
jgi:hypothetical protein